MRYMTQAASDQVGQQFGAEPVIVVAINVAGNFIYFGDREDEHGRFRARITEVAGLDSVINISMNQSHAAVTIQFIDVDGELKLLFDRHDLHKKPCRIYQYFPGTNFETDRILLFDGQLASPIVYDEAQMTLTVTGLSKIEDVEVGFSPDNSLWNDIIPNEIEPRAWPMPFGTPVNYPLVQITNEAYGALVHGFGIPDISSKYLSRARQEQMAHNNQAAVYASQASYVSIFKLQQLASVIQTLQGMINERQELLNRVQVRLADKMTDLADRDAPTPREGSPEELAARAVKEMNEQIEATRQAAVALGFQGSWRPSALRENLLRNAQYELQDSAERYNNETQRIQQQLALNQQEFSRLAQKRQQWDQEQKRRTAAALQALAQYNEEMQQLSRELAHSLLASSYARDLGLPIGQGLYSPGLGNTITIWNGPRFPFDRPVWLKIGSALVRGRFKHKSNAHEGVSEFKVSETVHPLTCDFTGRHCTELDSERLRLFPTVEYGKYTSLANQKLREWGEANDLPSDITDPQQTDKSVLIPTMLDWLKRAAPNKVSQFRLSLGQYEDVQVTGQRAGFHWVNSGSPVRLAYGNPIEFVLSIVPCRLIRLAAYRTYAGQRHLTTVPPEWYTIEQQDYGDGLVATVVVLQRPLDTIANANFEAQLYATVESDIGPNVVDVIRYLVEKYLPNATCDDTTFNQVKAEVDIWPVNFALLDRYNILELLSTICYQACIGIWFSEGVVRLRYLPNMPEQTTDLTESNIDTESLRINYTPTEDITTKIVATYLPSYDVDRPTRLAARYNISKYGVTEQNIDYLIYNDREAVVHSLTFWLIRTANTWKYLEFTTALDTLIFETMDAITVKLPGDFCANGPVTGIVEQVEYDSLQFTLRYRVWLPVRAGEMETYKFAYYNIGDIDDEFPEPQDWATGNGLGPPLIRQWKTGGRGPRYMGFTAEYLSDIPELQPMQAPVMLQPKKPRRRYAAEPESESGTGFPDFSPVIGGYGDPQLPSSPEINLPSISGDTTPEDGPSEAGFLPDGPFDSPRSADPTGTTLSLSRTLILDERSGEFAVLSSFFKGVRNNRLSISSKLPVIDDEDRAGIFEMLHVPGTTDFAAKLAYLAEDG